MRPSCSKTTSRVWLMWPLPQGVEETQRPWTANAAATWRTRAGAGAASLSSLLMGPRHGRARDAASHSLLFADHPEHPHRRRYPQAPLVRDRTGLVAALGWAHP